MPNTELVWRDLARYISTTRAAVNKLIDELEEKEHLDIERLQVYIDLQKEACSAMQSSIDNLLERSKDV